MSCFVPFCPVLSRFFWTTDYGQRTGNHPKSVVCCLLYPKAMPLGCILQSPSDSQLIARGSLLKTNCPLSGEAKSKSPKSARLVGTCVAPPLKYPPLVFPYRGNTGGYGGEQGPTTSKFRFFWKTTVYGQRTTVGYRPKVRCLLTVDRSTAKPKRSPPPHTYAPKVPWFRPLTPIVSSPKCHTFDP